jgi:beta-glucosidase
MPGPAKVRGEKLVRAAVDGEAHRSAIAASAGRVVQLVRRVGAFEGLPDGDERAVDDPAHRRLIRRAGAMGIVLLTNNGLLPLAASNLESIAVIGPNGAVAQIMGGGSSQINAHYRVSPLDGIRAAVGDSVQVTTAQGCTNTRLLPPVAGASHLEFFASADLTGQPARAEDGEGTDFMWVGHLGPGIDFSNFSVRLTTAFTPDRTATFHLGAVSSGPVRVSVDDRLVIDQWDEWQAGGEIFGLASREYRGALEMVSGRTYRITVENRTPVGGSPVGLKILRLGIGAPTSDADLDTAARLAAESDVAVVCVGLSGEWDTEGMDRPHMDLPGRQDELVRRIAAANSNTIVILQSGGPLTLPWVDEVAAVLQAWYPGQECGNAIADVLFGMVNPSGRLPQSWPVTLANNPATLSYPGERGVVKYREGVYSGYRFYDTMQYEPLFAFGHGLSYTAFTYGDVRVSANEIAPGESVTVEVDVTNMGDRAGAEVVQLYVRDVESELPRPDKELKAFARIDLGPGETGTVSMTLDMRSFAYFDDLRNAWIAEPGSFELLVGSSSRDIRICTAVTLTGDWVEAAVDAWRSRMI